MRRPAFRWFVAAVMILSSPALAQVIWDVPKEKGAPKQTYQSPVAQSQAEVWPRLDPGAVLCKTEDDLLRLAASRRGEQVLRPNCQLIRAATAISIEKRAGIGRTQVSLKDQNGQDGWTDAWLPDKAPPIGGRSVTIK
jgi:hypothetical protein